MSDSVEKLAYDEVVRGVESQRDSLSELRTRTGTPLAAAALVTTFIGGRALRAPNSEWTTVAIVAFVVLVICAFIVLLPWKLYFALEPSKLVKDWVDSEPQGDPRAMLRDLALNHEASMEKNHWRQAVLFWSFRAAVILLGVEVIAWLIELEKEGDAEGTRTRSNPR